MDMPVEKDLFEALWIRGMPPRKDHHLKKTTKQTRQFLREASPYLLQKTNMTLQNPPFEDVFPIENGTVQCHVTFQGCNCWLLAHLNIYDPMNHLLQFFFW